MNASQSMTVARRLSLGFGLIILVLIATFLFSIHDTSSKFLTAHYAAAQIVWMRYLCQFTLVLLIAAPGRWCEITMTRRPLLTILRGTLVNGVSPRLKGYPELAQELMNLVSLLDETVSGNDLEMLGRRLKRFWIRLELVLEQEDRLANALAGLLGVLLDNISELVGTDSRVGGQVEAMRDILSQAPLSMRKIYQLEASLKEAVYQQGLIKHSLDEATDSMRSSSLPRVAKVLGPAALSAIWSATKQARGISIMVPTR